MESFFHLLLCVAAAAATLTPDFQTTLACSQLVTQALQKDSATVTGLIDGEKSGLSRDDALLEVYAQAMLACTDKMTPEQAAGVLGKASPPSPPSGPASSNFDFNFDIKSVTLSKLLSQSSPFKKIQETLQSTAPLTPEEADSAPSPILEGSSYWLSSYKLYLLAGVMFFFAVLGLLLFKSMNQQSSYQKVKGKKAKVKGRKLE